VSSRWNPRTQHTPPFAGRKFFRMVPRNDEATSGLHIRRKLRR
jgi:hypothetical protein